MRDSYRVRTEFANHNARQQQAQHHNNIKTATRHHLVKIEQICPCSVLSPLYPAAMVTRDDQWGEAEVDQMSDKLQSTIQGRSDAITGRLDAIVEKITEVEEKFDAEMAKIPVDIKRRGEELTKMLVSRETKPVNKIYRC